MANPIQVNEKIKDCKRLSVPIFLTSTQFDYSQLRESENNRYLLQEFVPQFRVFRTRKAVFTELGNSASVFTNNNLTPTCFGFGFHLKTSSTQKRKRGREVGDVIR